MRNNIDQFVDKFLPIKVLVLRILYQNVLRRLRRQYGRRKIKVGFLVSEIAKWKGQTLYDYLADSQEFEPFIYVFPCSRDLEVDKGDIDRILSEKSRYFLDRGMKVYSIWDTVNNRCIPASETDADLVFFQQSWDLIVAPFIRYFAPRALTFYFPYYLVNIHLPQYEIGLYLHHYVFRHILLNEMQVNLFKPYHSPVFYAGKMVGLGHPCVDLFYLKRDYKPTKDYVIYAPHFSFRCDRGKEIPYYSSTFLEQGRFMLAFAKKHPEINWAFKPHPRLRSELTVYNVWSEEEVNQYYLEWEQIGVACYDADYQELFLESKALVTDCSSFLSEYSCTGKPLIRLIPDEGRTLVPPNPALEKLYHSFYLVYNSPELEEVLDMVVLRDLDPKKTERQQNAREAGLADHYAAKSITDHIRSLLKK